MEDTSYVHSDIMLPRLVLLLVKCSKQCVLCFINGCFTVISYLSYAKSLFSNVLLLSYSPPTAKQRKLLFAPYLIYNLKN